MEPSPPPPGDPTDWINWLTNKTYYIPIARTYDGTTWDASAKHTWEMSTLSETSQGVNILSCTKAFCSLSVPDDGFSYIVDAHNETTYSLVTANPRWAPRIHAQRLLAQATWGPTNKEVKDLARGMGDQTPSLTPGKPEPNLFPGNPTNPSPGRRLTDDPFAGYVHAIVGGVKAAPEDGVKNPPENLPCKKKPCDDSEEGGKGEPADLRKAASDWVRAQMDAPPTSHRAYYRERQNPRSHTDLSWKDWYHMNSWYTTDGAHSLPCDEGARYRRYALTVEDLRAPISITAEMQPLEFAQPGACWMPANYETWCSWSMGDDEYWDLQKAITLCAESSECKCVYKTWRGAWRRGRSVAYGEGYPTASEPTRAEAGARDVAYIKGSTNAGPDCQPGVALDWPVPEMRVAGRKRTDVWMGGWNALLGTPLTAGSSWNGTICEVTERVNGRIRVVPHHQDCRSTPWNEQIELQNPAVVFAPKAHGIIDTESNVIALSSSEATLTPLANLGPTTNMWNSLAEPIHYDDVFLLSAISSAAKASCSAQPSVGKVSHTVDSLGFVRHELPSPATQSSHVLVHTSAGQDTYYIFEPRLRRLDNDLEHKQGSGPNPASNPASAANGQRLAHDTCPVVAKSFLNADSCRVRPECSPRRYTTAAVELSRSNLRLFYELNGRFVYVVDGLELAGESAASPCIEGSTSRWLNLGGGCGVGGVPPETPLPEATKSWLRDKIAPGEALSWDYSFDPALRVTPNPWVRDIIARDLETCSPPPGPNATSCCDAEPSTTGARVEVAGECWEHVNRDLLSVVDASQLARSFDYNYYYPEVDNRVERAARARDATLASATTLDWSDPSWKDPYVMQGFNGHGMAHFQDSTTIYWDERRRYLAPFIGKLGDTVSFSTLPSVLQTPEMARAFGARLRPPDRTHEVCGSPGEVASDPSKNHRYEMYRGLTRAIGVNNVWDQGREERYRPYRHDDRAAKNIVWSSIAMHQDDQLRGRVAWALSQILVTSEQTTSFRSSETWAAWYDLFTRHAFGNYKDLLREVSYSPIMGEYLTYVNNKALAVTGSAADENYAREIKQLFTVGLWTLNNDGSRQRDAAGNPVPSYTTAHIMSYARAWTGFTRAQFRRGNVEDSQEVDPMHIEGSPSDSYTNRAVDRDTFPKLDLHEGHIGDRYPVCSDMAPRDFLRIGASYRYLGRDPRPKLQDKYSDSYGNEGITPRLHLPADSSLYQTLCGAGVAGWAAGESCGMQSAVTLENGLEDSQFDHLEHSAVVVVGLTFTDTSTGIAQELTVWYEYVRPPCVELTFYTNSKRVRRLDANSKHQVECADPRLAVASTTCCRETDLDPNSARGTCNFLHELLPYADAEQQCADNASPYYDLADYNSICENHRYTYWERTGGANEDCMSHRKYAWTSTPCDATEVQVSPDGYITLVQPDSVDPKLRLNSGNIFKVRWADNQYPKVVGGVCTDPDGVPVPPDVQPCRVESALDGSSSCVCSTTVSSTVVFADATDLPSQPELEASLRIGSFSPDYHLGEYELCTSAACDEAQSRGITSWTRVGAMPRFSFTEDTIFSVVVNGTTTQYLANRASTVHVPRLSLGSGPTFSFANPPKFMSFIRPTTRDAQFETEAVLDSYLKFVSTPPFVGINLIKRLTSSNPSPNYVDAVATAFKTGAYGGVTYGGSYADLGATVAAILLHPEARASVLEMDTGHGKLAEPIVQFMGLMRSMQYESPQELEVDLYRQNNMMLSAFGQEPYNSPSVFNFYKPEYIPSGPLEKAGLTSPEATLLQMPLIIATSNANLALIRNGLSSCDGGLGANQAGRMCGSSQETVRSRADGLLSFVPSSPNDAEQVVDELNVLMAGGRLHDESRQVLIRAFQEKIAAGLTAGEALTAAQELMTFSSEYHTRSRRLPVGPRAPEVKSSTPHPSGFRGIVYIFLDGGADSYSLVVPKNDCPARDLYADYAAVKGTVAYTKEELLSIHLPPGTQPCNEFGLHPQFTQMQRLFTEGEATILLNGGTLVEPITKETYSTGDLPPSLFAHNIQQTAIQNLYASNIATADGFLGRTMAALAAAQPSGAPSYRAQVYSVAGSAKATEGELGSTSVSTSGSVTQLHHLDEFGEHLKELLNKQQQDLMGETYTNAHMQAIEVSASLAPKIEGLELHEPNWPSDSISRQLSVAAKLIAAHAELESDRTAVYTSLGGFDTHSGQKDRLTERIGWLDTALGYFEREMKQRGMWGNVTIQIVSEFGRTNNNDNQGTDHAWAGHSFVVGGALKGGAGGRALGHYPPEYTSEAQVTPGDRMRSIPSTSMESISNAIAGWLGMEEADLPAVLPLKHKFEQPGCQAIHGTAEHPEGYGCGIMTKEDVFGA